MKGGFIRRYRPDTSHHRGHLPECESLRGIAIVLVFCFHYLGSLRGYEPYANMPAGAGLIYGGNTGSSCSLF